MRQIKFEERVQSVERAVEDLRRSLSPHFFRHPDHIGYSVPTEQLREHIADLGLAKLHSYEAGNQRHFAAHLLGSKAVGGELKLNWVKLIEHQGREAEQTYDYVAFYSNDLMADKKSLRKSRIPVITTRGRDDDFDWIEFELSDGHNARLVDRRLEEVVRNKRLTGEVIEVKTEHHRILDALNDIAEGDKSNA